MTMPGLNQLERVAFGGAGWRTPAVRGRQASAVPTPADAPGKPSKPARERRDWAYFGLLAFTAVLFFRPQDVFPPLEVLHLAEVAAIVGLGAMISNRLARSLPVLPRVPEVTAVIVFAAVMLALTPFSVWPGGSIAMLTGLYLKVVLIVILMADTLTTEARIERLAWLIIVASGYIAFRAVFDYARGLNLIENGRVAGAVGGVFGNPNDLALNMVAFLAPALLLAARRGTAPTRVVAAVSALLMFVAIIFTKSRGGFLGLGGMLLVMLVQGGKVRRGFGAAILVSVLIALPFLPSSFWARMASITDESEDQTGSREARKTVMTEAFDVFLQKPLTGVGPGEFHDYNPTWRSERYREAHNVWLQVASEEGVFGVLAFGSLVIIVFRSAWSTSRLLNKRQSTAEPASSAGLYATAMTASLAGWFVCSMFASVAYTWTFYYVLGIGMGARLVARRGATAEPRKRASLS